MFQRKHEHANLYKLIKEIIKRELITDTYFDCNDDA